MRTYCDHIREDAYECTQKSTWSFHPEDEPYITIYSCNDHLIHLLPRSQGADIYYVGPVRA